MLRRSLMKRLSKSASDISGCKRKSHTTSPDEEEKDFCSQQHQEGEEDEGKYGSAHDVSKIHNGSNNHHSAVGFIRLFRERISGKKNREALLDEGSRTFPRAIPNCPISSITGEEELVATEEEVVEVVRFRREFEEEKLLTSPRPEVVRHFATPMSTLPMALAQELEMARKKEEMMLVKQQSMCSETSSFQSAVPEVSVSSTDTLMRSFSSHTSFVLYVHLKQGFDLAARDSNGTSDPYVKFLYKGKVAYRSKTVHKDLNPYWDEQFALALDDPHVPIEIKVYDYDWAFRDDFMGECSISLTTLELEKPRELLISLNEHGSGSSEYLGQLSLAVVLEPKSDDLRSGSVISLPAHPGFGGPTSSNTSNSVRSKSAAGGNMVAGKGGNTWAAVVNVVLVEGRDLLAMDVEGTSDPYCKFRLGTDRYKSKPVFGTLNPKWLEQFDLNLFADQSQEMEITVWDKEQRSKDDFMGRCSVDLSQLARDTTNDIWRELEDGAGRLHLLVSVSGLTSDYEALQVTDEITGQHHMVNNSGIPESKRRDYSWKRAINNLNDVGFLRVKVFGAKGLHAADLGGKSDPYVVLELDNQRVQTHTEYKTITPTWNRVFSLPVTDVNSVLIITVYDEDRNHAFEFLGKLSIPLLRVDPGHRKWFALKDKKLRCRAKGNNPQILLELDVAWNALRASVRTLNPKEEKYMQPVEKFKRQVFLNNVMRIKAIIMEFVTVGKFVESCLEWEHPIRSAVAFAAFLVVTYFFQPYMFPIGLLLVFLKNYVISSYLESAKMHHPQQQHPEEEEEEEDAEDKEEDKEEKKSLKARLQAVQEVTALVQSGLGYVASLGEEVKNTFNFSVPFLSWLAIVILVVVTLILYYISLRFLVIVWGINKFTKKLIRPNTVTNNELLDFLSRVPDDEELLDFRELKLHADDPAASAAAGKGKKKVKQT